MIKKIKGAMICAAATGLIIFGLSCKPVNVYAEEEATAYELSSYDDKLYVLDKVFSVDTSASFTFPATNSDNFDIIIEINGKKDSTENATFSITYDRVTDDQTVANVLSDQNDRSGLLNETVAPGKSERRRFSIAATGDKVTITVTGNVEVGNIFVTKQDAKTAGSKVTVYSVGDSLVQTYNQSYYPQTGWGQVLPKFFTENVLFSNKAIGGRSTGNFIKQGRLNDTLLSLRPGDLVLIEFGHNDANHGNADRYVSVADYKTNLTKEYIEAVRARGGIPILVTVVNQNSYRASNGTFIPSYEAYVKAMKEVSEETGCLLIDVNAYTIEFLNGLNEKYGKGISDGIFYLTAAPGAYEGQYAGGVSDGTHTQYYGASVVAEYIATQLKAFDISGVSEEYVAKEATTVLIPIKPRNLAAVEDSKYDQHITWSPATNATFYEVQIALLKASDYSEDGEVWYTMAQDYKFLCYTSSCHATNKSVLAGAKYVFRVRSHNETGYSDWSEPFSYGVKVVTENELAAALEKKRIADEREKKLAELRAQAEEEARLKAEEEARIAEEQRLEAEKRAEEERLAKEAEAQRLFDEMVAEEMRLQVEASKEKGRTAVVIVLLLWTAFVVPWYFFEEQIKPFLYRLIKKYFID